MKKYKIKNTFMLKKIMDEYIVVPVGGETADFNSMITLNETGAFIWDCMSVPVTENEIAVKMLKDYSVSEDEALSDIKGFIKKLADAEVLEDD